MAGRVGPHTRHGIDLPLWSAGAYVAPVTRVISQAKDHHRWDGITLLGFRLALAVAGLVDHCQPCGPGILVPIPSTPSAVRERGLDFTYRLAVTSTRVLRRAGLSLSVVRALKHGRKVSDQGSLTTEQRHRNLHGSLEAKEVNSSGWIVVVDDVVTTGASLAEGIRALGVQGRTPLGLATIAATSLRSAI
jgi:predicted amidophosphoribosyltransferase